MSTREKGTKRVASQVGSFQAKRKDKELANAEGYIPFEEEQERATAYAAAA